MTYNSPEPPNGRPLKLRRDPATIRNLTPADDGRIVGWDAGAPPNLPEPNPWRDDLQPASAATRVVTFLCFVFVVAALVVFAVAVRR